MTDLVVERVPLSLEDRLDFFFNGPKATQEELQALLLIRAVLAEGWREGSVADLNALHLWCRLLDQTGHWALSGAELGFIYPGRPWNRGDAALFDEAMEAGYSFHIEVSERSARIVLERRAPVTPSTARLTPRTDE